MIRCFCKSRRRAPSVLEPFAGKSAYEPGQRIVVGQRLMQEASDLFLGSTHGENGRYFYVVNFAT